MSAKRVSSFGVLAAAVAALVLPVPMQAEAAAAKPGNGVCESGEFCIYRDGNRSGPLLDLGKGVDAISYTKVTWAGSSSSVEDKVSSVWNRSTCKVKVFRSGKFTPPASVFQPSAIVNLKGTAVGDDTASSHDACV